jgi:hypothetical protein
VTADNKPREYFIPFSHTSLQGSGYGSMTVVTPDGLMTPSRLNETIALVKSENPGRDIVVLGFFPLDREPADESGEQ